MIFYDTCALLNVGERILNENFIISVRTLREIEDIKNNRYKDEEVKSKAKRTAKLLINCNAQVVMDDATIYKILDSWGWDKNKSDNIIIATAYAISQQDKNLVFITDDICCRLLANVRGLTVQSSESLETEDYKGYLEVEMNDEEMADFYQNPHKNKYNLNINEYLIVKNLEKDNVYKWTGNSHANVSIIKYHSDAFGEVKPRDAIQQCAFDSINNNQITMLFGRAGSGKTLIPMAYGDVAVSKGKYNNMTFIYSYDVLKGAKDLGYERGDHMTKLLNYGAIGNILGTKYGDITAVERKMQDGDLNIYPTAYIRGVSITDSIVIITEAQNLDSYTLKTIIQRCEDNCKIIIEGDMIEQSDTNVAMRGMRRFSEVFRGQPNVGIIKLRENYRSKIGELADKM